MSAGRGPQLGPKLQLSIRSLRRLALSVYRAWACLESLLERMLSVTRQHSEARALYDVEVRGAQNSNAP